MISCRSTIIIPTEYAFRPTVGDTPSRQRPLRRHYYDTSLLYSNQASPSLASGPGTIHHKVESEKNARHRTMSTNDHPLNTASLADSAQGLAGSTDATQPTNQPTRRVSSINLGSQAMQKQVASQQLAARKAASKASMRSVQPLSEDEHARNTNARPKSHMTLR